MLAAFTSISTLRTLEFSFIMLSSRVRIFDNKSVAHGGGESLCRSAWGGWSVVLLLLPLAAVVAREVDWVCLGAGRVG